MRRNRVGEARHPVIVRLRALVKAVNGLKHGATTKEWLRLYEEVDRAEKFLRRGK
jgi:hypothetical protein